MPKKTEFDLLMGKASEEEAAMHLIRTEIIITGLATSEYNGPLGVIPYNVEIDMKNVEENFLYPEIREYLLSRVLIMDRICGKYDLEFPTDSKRSDKKQFRVWFKSVVEKRWSADRALDILRRHDYLCDFMNRHVAKYKEEQRRKNEK